MYVTRVPNRGSPPAVLLRESYRDGGKVRTRTLANLSRWPDAKVEALRRALKGERLAAAPDRLTIERSLPHGHVAAVLDLAHKLGLARLLPQRPQRLAKLALALIVARVLEPAAKLATARQLSEATAAHSLGAVLGLGAVDADELDRALDLLGGAQAKIETTLARRHLRGGCLVLGACPRAGAAGPGDLTSSSIEGRRAELARFGDSRDGKRAKLQIVFGLLCAADGCPVAVEVFEGDTADPATLAAQIAKLRQRLPGTQDRPRWSVRSGKKLGRVVLVGDRGMITKARIEAELKPAGLDWITALRAPAIQALAADGGPLQLSLFDQRDLAEITSPDYPGERLIVGRNPDLATERARKRAALLAATEAGLAKIRAATLRASRPLRGQGAIALEVGAVLGRRKMAKRFGLTITDTAFVFARDAAAIAREAALDGVYVLRTSVPAADLDATATVRAYQSLAQVERAFRALETVDLEVRPSHHRLASRVRAHVFLCLLADHLQWHLRRALAPLLLDDHSLPSGSDPRDRAGAEAQRAAPVAAAQVSPAARAKARTKRTTDGQPTRSFRSLLADLATLTRNSVRLGDAPTVTLLTEPTPLQQTIFDHLGLALAP